MKIVLIDDHPLVTASLADRLRSLGHDVFVHFTLQDARRFVQSEATDLCILDIDLGGDQGTDLLLDPALADCLPSTVVILSGTTDRDEIVMALYSGAHAFVTKSIPFDDVVKAVLDAVQFADFDEPVMWAPAERCFKPASEMFPRGVVLSPRERDVFRLLRRGLTDKAIATELERSVHTIRVQIRSILRKRGKTRRSVHY
jgi:DNA-binding NarL/FixJ family response regulator